MSGGLRLRRAAVWQLALTTLREFLRSREALFWTLLFPVGLAVMLGWAFETRDRGVDVAVVGERMVDLRGALRAAPEPGAVELRVLELPVAEATRRLARGAVDVVLGGEPAAPELSWDPDRVESRLGRAAVEAALQAGAGRVDVLQIERRADPAPRARYVAFLLPGLIGLNLLGAGLWGVGFNLVDMRIKQLLRRLVVAPMHKAEFLIAVVLSRVAIAVATALLLVAFGALVYGVGVRGSWPALLATVTAASVAFSCLGLLVASRPRTIEGMSGMINLVMLPMWLMCGTFFAVERFPEPLRSLTAVLPLTHVNDALRAVMLDGVGFAGVWSPLAFLLGTAVVCLLAALRMFRWT